MKEESEKYIKVLKILRNSKPELKSTEDIETEVIKRIKKIPQSGLVIPETIDFLFSWVYIGWVRRSLITASVFLVLIFVYQQGAILKRIDVLSRQTIVIDKQSIPSPTGEIEKLLLAYKNSGRRFPVKTLIISEKQMKELLETVNELEVKYKDLENLMEEDPELKKLIEKKLEEKKQIKIKL